MALTGPDGESLSEFNRLGRSTDTATQGTEKMFAIPASQPSGPAPTAASGTTAMMTNHGNAQAAAQPTGRQRPRASRGRWVGPRPRPDGTWDPADFQPMAVARSTEKQPLANDVPALEATAPTISSDPGIRQFPSLLAPRDSGVRDERSDRHRTVVRGLASILATQQLSDDQHEALVAAMQMVMQA